MNGFFTLLAQTSAPTTSGSKPVSPMSDPFWGLIVPMLLIMVVMWYFTSRSQRSERDKHQKMLNSLKRNDRVMTIGGVFGSVVEVRDHEVVLKVDESNNTKMRFARSAIKEVLGGDTTTDAAKK